MDSKFFVVRFNPFTGRIEYLRTPRSKFWTYEVSLAHRFSRGAYALVKRHNSDCLPGLEYYIVSAL